MRSAWYGFHDGVVGGVSNWCLCEDFDQGVKCREVYIPSSVVSVQVVVQFAPGLTENGSRNIPNTMCGLVGTFLISAKMFLIPCHRER